MSKSLPGIIMCKVKGEDIPSDFLNKVTGDGWSVGLAMAALSNGVPYVAGSHNLKAAEISWDHVTKTYHDTALALYFVKGTPPFDEDNLQPWTLFTNQKGKDAAACFLSGDYVGFDEPESALPPERHFFDKILKPKFAKLYIEGGQSIEKFMTELATPLIKTEINAMCGNNSTLLILGQNGQFHSFLNNPKQKSFKWGWASDTLGYGEHPEVIQQPVVEDKSSDDGFNLVKKTGAQPVITPAKTVEDVVKPPPTDTAPPKPVDPEQVVMHPPPWLKNNNDLKEWYDRKGSRPQNWKDKPPIVIKRNFLSKREIEYLAGSSTETVTAVDKVTGKETKITLTEEKTPKTEVAPSAEITAFQKDFIPKIMGANGEMAKNPLTIQSEEAKWDSWADTLKSKGVLIPGLEIMFTWSDELLQEHILQYPELTLALIKDLRYLVIQNYKTKAVEQKPPTETKPVVEDNEDGFNLVRKAS